MKKNGSCGGTISPFHGRTKAMTMEVERMVVNTNTVMQMACTEMVLVKYKYEKFYLQIHFRVNNCIEGKAT